MKSDQINPWVKMKEWDKTFQDRKFPAWFKKCLWARDEKLHPDREIPQWETATDLCHGRLWDHHGSVQRDGFRAVITQPYENHDAEAQQWAEELGCVLAVAKKAGIWHDWTWYYEFHPKPPKRRPRPPVLLLPDVMERFPTLTYFGFGRLNGLGALWTPEQFQQQRDELKAATAQIDDARSWIKQNCAKQSTINESIGSYNLKHKIENDLDGYISNGACIAAFVMEGYRVHHAFDWGPNCAFNVSFPKPPPLCRRPQFKTFLKTKQHQNDAIGNFARDWLEDRRYKKPSGSNLAKLIAYLESVRARSEYITAAEATWNKWREIPSNP